MELKVLYLKSGVIEPSLAYDESAAFDLSAYQRSDGGHLYTQVLPPRMTKLIGTGLAMRPPDGHLVLICSRSGLAARSIFVANAPGVVDPSYTGEIKVALYNGGLEAHYVKHGDRIAQALVIPFASNLTLREVSDFPETERGARGFGSSGD